MHLIISVTLFFLMVALADHPDNAFMKSYTDPRDGQVYETIEIGDRVWFKENLNFVTPGSLCYDNLETNCDKYGRLYSIVEAAKVCPEYWRLPNQRDIDWLYQIAGTDRIDQIAIAGEWEVKGSGKFENSTGMSILPAGRIDSFSMYVNNRKTWVDTLAFHQLGTAASYWLHDEETADGVLHWHIGEPIGESKSGMHRHRIFPEIHKFSIRCVCLKSELK